MKHLIDREEYIKEYLHISNEDELNEGLLGTLFGGLKMLLKRDWANIKCKNPSVLKHLQAIDKSLSGYTMTKMQFSNECQNIRQNVADYFNDILNYKLSQIEKVDDPNAFIENEDKEIEENKDAKGVAKNLNLKDKTLLDSLKKYKDNIATACKPNPKLREYSDQMLNTVEVFVNDVVLAELEKKGADKEKLKDIRKEIEEEQKKLDEIKKKLDEETKKATEEAMKKIAEERKKALVKLGVKPIENESGDKVIETIAKSFSEMMEKINIKDENPVNESAFAYPKGFEEILKSSDEYIGIKKSLEELKLQFSDKKSKKSEEIENIFIINVILNKINTAFGVVAGDDIKNKCIETPSASIQSMMIALSNAIIYGFMGDKFKINDAILSLLTKCVIDSDATIGFNLPLIEEEKPDNGNIFLGIMNQLKKGVKLDDEITQSIKNIKKDLNNNNKYKGKNEKELSKEFGSKLMDNFKSNMEKLYTSIEQKAKEIKEKAQKEREAEAAKAQQESEAAEK